MLKPQYADRAKEQLHHRKGKEMHFNNKGAKELPSLWKGDVVRVRPKEKKKSGKNLLYDR